MKRPRFYVSRGFLGFRLFGKWVRVRDVRVRPPLFSERNGLVKTWSIGWLWVSVMDIEGR